MEIENVVLQLSALAQESRLKAWRLLIEAGPQGMTVGAIGAGGGGFGFAEQGVLDFRELRVGLVHTVLRSRLPYRRYQFVFKEHLIRAWQNIGRKPKDLDAHGPIPRNAEYLWQWFRELKKPIAYAELEAWARMTGREPERWEITALMRLDAIFHEVLR